MTNWMKKILATLCALALLLSCAAADSPEIPDIEAEDLELTQDEIAEPDNSQEENNDDDESEIIVSEVKSLSDEIEQAEEAQEEEQKEEPQEEDSAEDTVPADEADKPEEPDEIILNLNGRKTIRGSASQTNPFIVKATDDYSRTVLFTLTVPTENNISVTLNDKTLTLTKTDTEESIQYTFTCRLKKDEATSLFLTAREGTVSFTLTISKLEITEEKPADETKEEAEEVTEDPEETEEQPMLIEEIPVQQKEQLEERLEEKADEKAEENKEEPNGDTKESMEKALEVNYEEEQEHQNKIEVEETEQDSDCETALPAPESDLETNEEQRTDEQIEAENEDGLKEPPEDRNAVITISWDDEKPTYGSIAHFKATLSGYEGFDYAIQWQWSKDGDIWIDVEDATNENLDVIYSRENGAYQWRILVEIIPATGN